MKFLVFMFVLSMLNIEVKSVYEIWHPKALADLFANKTKVLIDNVEEKTNIVSDIINNYIDEVKLQNEEIRNDFENFIDSTLNKMNHSLNDYVSTSKNTSDEFKEKMKFFVGNIDSGFDPDMYLDTVQLAVKYGYEAESHIVKTEDGYLLTMHRIPHAKGAPTGTSGAQAVFLQHGLLTSSANFLTNGPDKGLAYILADAGYDVWLGNFRGNTYSRAHISLDVSSAKFWNFTFHECAMYDLPAMIDYVNKIKNSNEMLYVGHSMGTVTLFVLLSMRQEYNHKLKAAFCMAPVATMTSLKTPLRLIAPFANSVEWITTNLGLNEFLPQSVIMKWLAVGCKHNHIDETLCENILFVIAGFDEKEFNRAAISVILSHSPAGASTKTIIHFAQEINSKGRFQQYDYGSKENMIVYGQKTPPKYPISEITLPIALLYGNNDWLAGVPDVQNLYKKLVNPIELYEVPYENFNHLDFLWAVDAPTLVYKKLLELMEKYTPTQNTWTFKNMLNFNWL